MNKKNQIIIALTLVLTMSACTPATTITIEKAPDGSIKETIHTPPRMKKDTKKVIGIVIAGVALKSVDKNILPYVELVSKYMISDKKIENGIVDPNI